jgi:hypothetical protein
LKRLLRKAEPAVEEELVEDELDVGDSVPLDYDPQFEGLDINDLSRPEHRDGAVLVDAKENVVRWGLNGETHDKLFDKYYADVITDMDAGHYETDDYVVPGVYLKKFMGHEAIILYNDKVPSAANVIQNENPAIRVYFDDYFNDLIERIASKSSRLKRVAELILEDIEIGEEVDLDEDPKYRGSNVDLLSMPAGRDGAIIVDLEGKKIHWGLNGEVHSDLVNEIYNIDEYDDDGYIELDEKVSYGIYLKSFMGFETIILYGHTSRPEAVQIIQSENPDIRVYETTDEPEVIKRLAKRVG